ncbi:MAG: DUF5684 domain-containing protein [Bacillota bacterium]|nr:DUF5684 domain-containing protein [Bacillota bacterium]
MYNDSLTTPSVPPVLIMIYLALVAFMIVTQWVLYEKAGQPGWACIIPIYNIIVYLKIGGKPWYWLLLMCIPFVNIIFSIMVLQAFLKAYGKGGVGSVLLALFFSIFYLPYLAFSKNVRYQY